MFKTGYFSKLLFLEWSYNLVTPLLGNLGAFLKLVIAYLVSQAFVANNTVPGANLIKNFVK